MKEFEYGDKGWAWDTDPMMALEAIYIASDSPSITPHCVTCKEAKRIDYFANFSIEKPMPEKPKVPTIAGYELVEIYERDAALRFDYGNCGHDLEGAPTFINCAGYVYGEWPTQIMRVPFLGGNVGQHDLLRPKWVAFKKEV